jgi:beta-glucuronidase
MTRERLDLCGLWRCQPDPYNEGEAAGCAREDLDVRLWREVAVPSSFAECAPGMESYEGACWYRRTFRAPASWRGKRVVVRFEGVNYHARVWVNGEPAGEHADGFLPFELPVHEMLRTGRDNVIAVCVDNVRRQGEVPGTERGWRPYGGILREVALVAADHLHVSNVCIMAEPTGFLSARVGVVNGRPRAAKYEVAVDVLGAGGETLGSSAFGASSIEAGAAAEETVLTSAGEVTPWSPGQPVVYTARVRLRAGGKDVDAVDVRFGFRQVEAKDCKLLLNGEPLFLTGFNRHEDSPRTGPCTDLEAVRSDILEMKAAGANFVRLCHYPHHPGELDLCDELGLVAMVEVPLYWWNGLAEGEENCAAKLEAARRQLTEMIQRDWNHPSVIFWSVSNETHEQRPEVAAGNAELVRLAQELDPTRPAVHVSDHWASDPHFEADDVICVNGYPTWMASARAKPDRFADSARFWAEGLEGLHALYPGKPILITEFGYPSLEGTFGGALGQDTQARAITSEYEGMGARYVCGTALWCWADHPWPEEPFIAYLTTSPFGVVTRQRRKRPARAVVESLFRAQPGISPAALAGPETSLAGWVVDMVRPDLADIPQVPFAEGFSIRAMRRGEGGVWTDVQRDAEPYSTMADDLFYEQFGSDLPATLRRCYFIVDEKGSAVGTISAWYDRHFKGQEWGRVHWVATRRAYQRRGLMKAGLSYTLNRMAEWHERACLTTQTKRLGAIRLYLDFGFVPDMDCPGAARAWREVRDSIKHPALDALDL